MLTPFIAWFLSVIIIFKFLPIVNKKIESQNGKKPKAYYQFWASQPLMLGLGIWTVVKNSYFNGNGSINDSTNLDSLLYFVLLVPTMALTLMAALSIMICSPAVDMNTPTLCCCCWRGFCRIFVTCLSISITTFFITVFIASIPSIILIYYLHPVQTLAQLPFVINSVLYVNSLTALLLYQLERCLYPCSPKSEEPDAHDSCLSPLFRERMKANNECYHDYPGCGMNDVISAEESMKYYFCSMELVATILVLASLLTLIVVLSDLINLDRSRFTDKNQMELLFTLVPTLALLFGSIYNLDFFFKDIKILKEKKEGKASQEEARKPDESTPLLRNTRNVLEESV